MTTRGAIARYTIATLEPLNQSYLIDHYINEQDVNKVNVLVQQIEEARQGEPVPQDGDIVICEKTNGEIVTRKGHLEKADWLENEGLTVCVHAYVPFIAPGKKCNASGGPWFVPRLDKLQYVGKDMKTFCTWGHFGMCARGAIDFKAEVNVWKIVGDSSRFV